MAASLANLTSNCPCSKIIHAKTAWLDCTSWCWYKAPVGRLIFCKQSNARVFFCFSVQFRLSRVRLFVTPWIAACQASLSITNSQSLPKLMPIESVMPSSHLILCHPFSCCPQSLPASGSFPMSQLFAWGGQSIGVSASAPVLPMNTQDLSPLGWTGWISLQSKGLSRVFSNTIVQSYYMPWKRIYVHYNNVLPAWLFWRNTIVPLRYLEFIAPVLWGQKASLEREEFWTFPLFTLSTLHF